jgi:predicted phage tail protein
MESVQWRVVEVDGEPLFALTSRGYESLSRNMADLARWMKEAAYQIRFYREQRSPANAGGTATTQGETK